MMLNLLGASPEKFSGGMHQGDRKETVVPGDPQWSALWKAYCAPNATTTDWTFRRWVLKEAVRLMGDGQWLTQVDQNAYIYGANYDFLVDTLRFILTGKRQLPVTTWCELISDQTHRPIDVDYRDHIRTLLNTTPTLRHRPLSLIQRWCSHPKGLDDMVCTLNVLFGDTHRR